MFKRPLRWYFRYIFSDCHGQVIFRWSNDADSPFTTTWTCSKARQSPWLAVYLQIHSQTSSVCLQQRMCQTLSFFVLIRFAMLTPQSFSFSSKSRSVRPAQQAAQPAPRLHWHSCGSRFFFVVMMKRNIPSCQAANRQNNQHNWRVYSIRHNSCAKNASARAISTVNSLAVTTFTKHKKYK